MGDLKEKNVIYSINVADNMLLLESKMIKLHTLTGSINLVNNMAFNNNKAHVLEKPELNISPVRINDEDIYQIN